MASRITTVRTFLTTSLTTHTATRASSTATDDRPQAGVLGGLEVERRGRTSTTIKLGALGTLNRVWPRSARSRCRPAGCRRRCCRPPIRVAEARLTEAFDSDPATRRDAVAAVVADLSALRRRLGRPRRRRRRHDRALRRLPRRVSPRPRRAAGQRVARLGLRALGGTDERRVPPLPARPAGDGGGDRRERRGRALRPVPRCSSTRPARRRDCGTPARSAAPCCAAAAAGASAATRRSSTSTAGRWRSVVGMVLEAAGCVAGRLRRRRRRPAHGRAPAGSSSPIRGPVEGPLGGVVDALRWFRRRGGRRRRRRGMRPADLTVEAVRAVAGAATEPPSPSPAACTPPWRTGRPRRPIEVEALVRRPACVRCTKHSTPLGATRVDVSRPAACTTSIVRGTSAISLSEVPISEIEVAPSPNASPRAPS